MTRAIARILLSVLICAAALDAKCQILSYPMAGSPAGMANWDRYPTYGAYLQLMDSLRRASRQCASIVRVGQSALGRDILAMRITAPGDTSMRVPVLITSSIHGDETTGMLLSLRLIDSLSRADADAGSRLLSRCVIYIIPMANPDGTYRSSGSTVNGATRENANGVDLNRNFPASGEASQPSPEPETAALMAFARSRRFAFSLALHAGDEVVNYPWDSYTMAERSLPDLQWWQAISERYVAQARKADSMYLRTVLPCGHVFGGEWYKAKGTMQDWMYEQMRCRETTLELSRAKTIHPADFQHYWILTRQAITDLIESAAIGFCGTVCTLSGDPVEDATIIVPGYDEYCSSVHTRRNGAYFRPMLAGQRIEACAAAEGYATQCMSLSTKEGSMEELNFALSPYDPATPAQDIAEPAQASITFDGQAIRAQSSQPIQELRAISASGQTAAWSKPMSSQIEMPAHNLKPGIYVIIIKTANFTKSLKISIAR